MLSSSSFILISCIKNKKFFIMLYLSCVINGSNFLLVHHLLRENTSFSGLLRSPNDENSSISKGPTFGSSSSNNLHLHLQACKLLDLALTLPTDHLPQFQMYRWAFVSNNLMDNDLSQSSRANRTKDANFGSIEELSYPSRTSPPLFEPFVVRIERIMRLKVKNPPFN